VVQSVWQHLATPLPALSYELQEVSTQGKSTTEYAAFSHTPKKVEDWEDFESLIKQEAQNEANQQSVSARVAGKLCQQLLLTVREEEHVTQNAVIVLNCAKGLLGVEFVSGNKYLKSNTDISALTTRVDQLLVNSTRVGPSTMYTSPAGPRKEARSAHMQEQRQAVRFPIESKPFWKYKPLAEEMDFSFAAHFEVPASPWTGTSRLPKEFPALKRKVFHLIRQIYGQMTEDNLRYGVIHIYEMWWFCRRDDKGTLSVSKGISRDATDPSVLQALKTVLRFDDYELKEAAFHDQTPIQAPTASKSKPGSNAQGSTKPAPSTPATASKAGTESKGSTTSQANTTQ
jgi:hypothetical protein